MSCLRSGLSVPRNFDRRRFRARLRLYLDRMGNLDMHSNHANSTDCDDVTGTLCVCLSARVWERSFNLCSVLFDSDSTLTGWARRTDGSGAAHSGEDYSTARLLNC